ncbi:MULTISPECIES: hypothetical protein [Salinibaculum]|uniref:hypothetical protein n=1 Tax=Salinibaculum TaxID=2732368 RepID=UPI0030CC08DE
MSQHEPDPEDAEDVPDIDLADPDDYHRRQRLKEIHKARQRVHKVMDNFDKTERLSEGRQERRELAYAVSLYVSELEPIMNDIDADTSLPDHWPHDTILQYADSLGALPSDADLPEKYSKLRYTPRQNSVQVYRICNQILADVKPLITEDESDEWEV